MTFKDLICFSAVSLFLSVDNASACTLGQIATIETTDRYLWCPGPKSRHIKKVIGAFSHSDFSSGKLTVEQVKSVGRGCGITTETKLFLVENKKPVFTTKPAATSDGQCMLIFKGVGGRRLVLIN